MNDLSPLPTATLETVISHHAPPKVMAHFKARDKISKLAEKRYSAPPNQAGLTLNSVVGYDGLGRNNMIWHPITGTFYLLNFSSINFTFLKRTNNLLILVTIKKIVGYKFKITV